MGVEAFEVSTAEQIVQQLIEISYLMVIQLEIAPLDSPEDVEDAFTALKIANLLYLLHNALNAPHVLQEELPIADTFCLIVHVLVSVERIEGDSHDPPLLNQHLSVLVLLPDPIDWLCDNPDLLLSIENCLLPLPLLLLEVPENAQQIFDVGVGENLTVGLSNVGYLLLTLLDLVYQQLRKVEALLVPNQNGDLTQGNLLLEVVVVNLINGPTCLGLLPLKGAHLHLLVVLPPRSQLVVLVESMPEKLIFLIGLDDLLGEVEEGLPQPVCIAEISDVLLVEAHPLLEEAVDSSDVHSSEGVDVLIEITHHQQFALFPSVQESLDHPQLGWVAVLELVNHH